MSRNETILQELKQISPVVANLSENNVYSVPTDYFNNLSGEVFSKIKTEELLSSLKTNPFSTPKGYFNQFEQNIIDKIKGAERISDDVKEELSLIAPTLNNIPKTTPFAVPSDYFENSQKIDVSTPKSKVVKLFTARKFVLYAAAAVFTTVLGIGIVKYIGTKNCAISIEKEFAKTNEDDLKKYLEENTNVDLAIHTTNNDTEESTGLLENVSVEEMKEYLNTEAETAEIAHKDS